MDRANGDYIWFIDSDDFIKRNVLKSIKEVAKTEPDRILLQSYSFTEPETEYVMMNMDSLQSNYPFKKLLVTRTIFKKDFLYEYGIKFIDGMQYGEDGMFTYKTRLYPHIDAVVDGVTYFYRRNPYSLTSIAKAKRIHKSLSGAQTAVEILKHDYNLRLNVSESRDMLLYWIDALIDDYPDTDRAFFKDNFRWDRRDLIVMKNDLYLRSINCFLGLICRFQLFKTLSLWKTIKRLRTSFNDWIDSKMKKKIRRIKRLFYRHCPFK